MGVIHEAVWYPNGVIHEALVKWGYRGHWAFETKMAVGPKMGLYAGVIHGLYGHHYSNNLGCAGHTGENILVAILF